MKKNGDKFQEIIMFDKKQMRDWLKIAFYVSFSIFLSLLLISVSYICYASVVYPLAGRLGPSSVFAEELGINIVLVPWSVSIFVTSGIGLIGSAIGNFLRKTMIIGRRRRHSIWKFFGEIEYHSFYKRATIFMDIGIITLHKNQGKYNLTLPIIKGIEFERFGFKISKEKYVGTSTKEELNSILHLYFASAN